MPAMPLLALAVAVPLTMADAWEVLAFRGIPPNRVRFEGGVMTIVVERSAGPIVMPLEQPTVVGSVRAAGIVTGTVATTPQRQGGPDADDFALRVGLVEAGDRRPSFLERRLAPKWVRHLFSLAPAGEGIGRIRFFNLGLDTSQIGRARTHPASDLLFEQIVAAPDDAGRFDFTVDAGGPATLAVWISADGDDTGSSFTVRLERLELRP